MKEHDNELELREQWLAEAKKQTLETLPAFLQKLADFDHGYGTIPRAVAAAALGAAYAMDKSPNGGITGFQASFVMWDFLSTWNGWKEDDVGHALVNYDNLLYPQYQDKFTTITKALLKKVQAKARKMVEGLSEDSIIAGTVEAHWHFLAQGGVPFDIPVRDTD